MNITKSLDNKERLLKPLFLVPTKDALQKAQAMTQALEIIESGKQKPCAAEAKSEALQLVSNSLVKSPKSPTDFFTSLNTEKRMKQGKALRKRKTSKLELARIEKEDFDACLHTCPEPLSLSSRKTISKAASFAHSKLTAIESTPDKRFLGAITGISQKTGEIYTTEKTCVRMYHQEWSGNYRLGLENGALGSKSAPPSVVGTRFTENLTKTAVKNILESGAYLSACRGGYTTFLTLTFSNESRKKILEISAIPQGKTKKYKWGLVRCIDGIHGDYGQTNNELDIEKAGDKKAYLNGVPASGPWCSVEFEPVSTIGKEVSRFFDASQKRYQNGWKPRFIEEPAPENSCVDVIYSSNTQKINSSLPMICPEWVQPFASDGETFDDNSIESVRYNPRKHNDERFLERMQGQQEKGAPLDYMWVAEMPENDKGEKNPHVHVLMRWNVGKPVFRAWAERLESIWGHGFAKLEKIKTPQAASNYLLKAVGYLTKGSASEQGEIRGNRYNISSSARAPKWECIGEFYADNFLAILGELREKLHRKKAKINAQTIACTQQRDKEKGLVVKMTNVNKIKEKYTDNRAGYIEKLKARLVDGDKAIKASNEQLHELPFINDFAISNLNETQASDFIGWAMRERFWSADVKENRYSEWSELKTATIEAVKENRRYWHNYAELLETSEITWVWAQQRSNYDLITVNENIMIDDFGNHWEQVA
jgi:hypothetical protein